MATKKTDKSKTTKKAAPAKKPVAKKAAAPKAPKEKREPQQKLPRHPKERVLAANKDGKAALAKTLAPSLVIGDEDSDLVATRLTTASNSQLLRLQGVVATVKEKYGSRDGLIEAIGKAHNKSKDKDYLTRLASYSLPQLLDLARSAERAAQA